MHKSELIHATGMRAHNLLLLERKDTYDESFAVGDAPILPLSSSPALNDSFVSSFALRYLPFFAFNVSCLQLRRSFQLLFLPPSK